MKTVRLSRAVALPVELTTRRSAVFGISGSGKSNTATVCIEGLLAAGEQVVLIDPKGEGHGLQSTADGKHAGFAIIVFGQPRGDIPELKEEHAEQIADFVVDSGRSVVLSLLGFDSDQSERRFVTRFFQRLYRRKSQQSAKTRTLVVLEEAHLFVPEQASGGVTDMVGAIKRIARQGRSAGLGLMIVDQRPQDVAKSIISQCELLICHQLTHKLDRAALQDWVRAYDREGQGEAFLESLAELQPGEAWVWSPGWLHLFVRTKIDRRSTYDSGATPSGTSAEAPKARAKVDLDALRTHLAKVVEQAKADDPKELRKEIAKLKAELAKRPTETKVETKEVRVEVPVLKNGELQRVEKVVESFRSVADKAGLSVAELATAISRARIPLKTTAGSITVASSTIIRQPKPITERAKIITAGDDSVGRGGLRRILIALAQRPGLNNRQLGLRAGLSSKSGTFSNYISKARQAGWIRDEGDRRFITDAGVAALGSYDPLPEGADLLNHWLGELGNSGAARMLRALADAYPNTLTNQQLGEAAEISHQSGTFSNYLSKLRGLELVEGRGELRASEELFER